MRNENWRTRIGKANDAHGAYSPFPQSDKDPNVGQGSNRMSGSDDEVKWVTQHAIQPPPAAWLAR